MTEINPFADRGHHHHPVFLYQLTKGINLHVLILTLIFGLKIALH